MPISILLNKLMSFPNIFQAVEGNLEFCFDFLDCSNERNNENISNGDTKILEDPNQISV